MKESNNDKRAGQLAQSSGMDSINAIPGTYVINDAPSPHGGVRTVVHFFDANNNPCMESDAKKFQILEYDATGVCIFSLITED